jgi:hypothetical protein
MMMFRTGASCARSDALRKVVGSLVAAGALAAVAVAPAAAELELCIVDPTVQVGGTAIQVGLFTHDPSLANGGIAAGAPIVVTLTGPRGTSVSTDQSAWQQHGRQTVVVVLNTLPGRATGPDQMLEIDAIVPSPLVRDTFYIKVTLPDGSERIASGRVNAHARMTVEVPVPA